MNKKEFEKNNKKLREAYTQIAEKYYEKGFCTASVICQQAKQDGLFENFGDDCYKLFLCCTWIMILQKKN